MSSKKNKQIKKMVRDLTKTQINKQNQRVNKRSDHFMESPKTQSSGEEYAGETIDLHRIPSYIETEEEILDFVKTIITILIKRVFPEKPRVLTLEKAGKCLKLLGKIWNLSEYPPTNYVGDMCAGDAEEKLMDMEGYVDEYQYLHFEGVNLALTDIRILPKHFVWLLSVDLSGNRLTNMTACPVTKLPNVVALKLNQNRFEDPYLPPMKHLQYLGLNTNKIKSLHRIYHPNLETLDLNYNEIESINPTDCWKLTKLTQLELRGNQLTTTSGIEFATLVNLYLAQNQITKLEGLEILVNLQRLHLRDNPLTELSGFTKSNINLKYLNVRKCQIEQVKQFIHLQVLKGLEELVMKGNLFNPEPEKESKQDDYDDNEEEEEEEEEDDEKQNEKNEQFEDDEIRLQILSYLPFLKRMDKKLVTKEEINAMREFVGEDY